MQKLFQMLPLHRIPRAVLVVVAVLLLAAGLRPAGSVLAACGSATVVMTESELSDAIDDFNSQAGPCAYEIEFGADITLTDFLPDINNAAVGLSLLIDGAGFTLDANDFDSFFAFDTAELTVQDITILNSDDDGIDVENGDLRVERATILGPSSDAVEFSTGTLVIIDSTLANSDDDGIDASSGSPTITIINSTIAGNSDDGLFAFDATTTLTHVTVAGNDDGLFIDEGSATINNSILTDNTANCLTVGAGAADINFSLLDSTDDACGATDGVDGNIVGENPLLLPLGDYGGPTPTISPFELTGGVTAVSPVIDEGSNALSVDEAAATLDFDQRGTGFPRELNGTVDMGAIEGAEVFACPTFPVTVVDEDELNAAILCYSGITTAGVYVIELDADTDLTASTFVIDNNEAGVSLVIEGNGNDIDGQDTPGVRPLAVAADTTVTLNDATITGGNVLNNENGGGILNLGDLTLNNVNVTENSTEDDGGGIFNEDDATMTITNSAVTSNHATYPDGDGGGISNDGTMTLTDSAVDGNTVDGDFGVNGGGVINEGVMTIVRSSVSSNTLSAEEEGIGGGIENQANLIIRDSAVINNDVTVTGIGAFGGGIYSDADEEEVVTEGYGGQLLIINSTISGNSASADEAVFGGGLYATDGCCLDDPVPVKLINTTLAGNSVSASNDIDFDGGGAYFRLDDDKLEVTIDNSILADSATDGAAGGDCVLENAPVFDSNFSLYEDSGAGACGMAAANPDGDGNIVGVDPALGPLGNNGGPTLTHLPGGGSEAIDAGSNPLAVDENGDPLTADQRGFIPRVVGGTVDMGSVEVGAEDPDGGGDIFMSTTTAGTTDDAVAFGAEDILRWSEGDWSLWFDGTAAGLIQTGKFKHNINAFWIPDPSGDDAVMSFTQNARIVPGIGPEKVDGMDLVWWDGSAFSLYFDGNDVGLTNKTQEKIDALHILPGSESPINGGACLSYLLISTQGMGKVPNHSGGTLTFRGEDVLGFCMTNDGDATAGLWHMFLDGSDQGMPPNATDSISMSADGNTLYLTTRGTFNVDAATGGHSMVYEYDMTTTDFSGPIFIAADYGLDEKVDGLQVE